MAYRRASVAERLEDLSMPEPNSGCVLWLGSIDRGGYGRIRISAAQGTKAAHVVAYELYVGPVPKGLDLDHLCRNRACRAVWHLEPVTRRVNVLRGVGPPAKNATKRACVNGHAFDERNTYIPRKNGGRQCRTCMNDATRRYRQRRKATIAATGAIR